MKPKNQAEPARKHLSYAEIENFVRNREEMAEGQIAVIEKHLQYCTFCKKVHEDCLLLEPDWTGVPGGADEFWEEIWQNLSQSLDFPAAEIDSAILEFEDKLKETSERSVFLFHVQLRTTVVAFWRRKMAAQGRLPQPASSERKVQAPFELLRSGLDQAKSAFVAKSANTMNAHLNKLNKLILSKLEQLK